MVLRSTCRSVTGFWKTEALACGVSVEIAGDLRLGVRLGHVGGDVLGLGRGQVRRRVFLTA